MTEYADPELLVVTWLTDTTGLKVYCDPKMPGNLRDTAAFNHLQRSPGRDDLALTLDEPVFDINTYAATADHAREAAHRIWTAMVFQLPRHVFNNGVMVKAVRASPPCWAPDPKLYRRTAAYRVMLHGVI